MGAPAGSASDGRTVVSALGVYGERPALVMVALGFSAGLPYFLIFDTLSAWLRASGLSLEVIGFFSLVTLVSTFKFLWAPFIDRTRVPVLGGWLGHRRSWMLVCQGLIILGLWLVAGSDPSRSLGIVAVFAVLVGLGVSHSGHRHRCLAHRIGGDLQAGGDGGRVSMGLPRRHHRRRRRAAAARRSLRLEFLVCGDGRPDGDRGAGRAGWRRAKSATPSVQSRPKAFDRRRRAKPWNGSPA